jgi:hypothetical protein
LAALRRAQLGAHQMELDRVRPLAVRRLRRAVLQIGHALRVERMGAQVRGRIALDQPRRARKPLEEHRHPVHVVAGRLEQGEADPIGFALEIARVVQLRLDRSGLPADDRRLRRLRIRARSKDREQHARQERPGHLRLLVDLSRNVSLRDVRDLVRHHTGQLTLGLCGEDQPGVHADVAAGHRERVDAVVAEREEVELRARASGLTATSRCPIDST